MQLLITNIAGYPNRADRLLSLKRNQIWQGSELKVFNEEINIQSTKRIQVIDITGQVLSLVKEMDFKNGVLIINVPHTTATITINEYESGLIQDIINLLIELFKPDGPWEHNKIDTNAHAHLASSIIGNSKCLLIKNGSVNLGTWQKILLIELDGPRRRRVDIGFIGE